MKESYTIFPVGFVRKEDKLTQIEIVDDFLEALLGLSSFSHMYVLYWFHENDRPENRKILQVHPRKNTNNPLTGVFATRSPVRPNLIAISLCKIESIVSNRIQIDAIDARDGSPVIDIKCYIPPKKSLNNIKLPDWV